LNACITNVCWSLLEEERRFALPAIKKRLFLKNKKIKKTCTKFIRRTLDSGSSTIDSYGVLLFCHFDEYFKKKNSLIEHKKCNKIKLFDIYHELSEYH